MHRRGGNAVVAGVKWRKPHTVNVRTDVTFNQLLDFMASDFSMYLGEVLGLEDAPADAFFDPITNVFGDEPTQESVTQVFPSANGAGNLARELCSWLETAAMAMDDVANLSKWVASVDAATRRKDAELGLLCTQAERQCGQ